MTLAKPKTRWWYALAMALGASIFFFLLVVIHGPPRGRERYLWYWPVATVPLALFAASRLRALYLLEPAPKGGWRLSIGDLLAVVFCMGTLFTLFQAADPSSFLDFGLPVTFVSGVLLVFGLLAATRAGFLRGYARFLFALGTGARLFGALGIGALLVCLLAIALSDFEQALRFAAEVFFIPRGEGMHFWILYTLRAGWICFALSFLLLHFAKKLQSEKLSTPPVSPS